MEDPRLQSDLAVALPKTVLEHGKYYGGKCRNAYIARWDANAGVFVHWRSKFNGFFTETIQHPEDAHTNRFDYFLPLFAIDSPQYPIPLDGEGANSPHLSNEKYFTWEADIRQKVWNHLKERIVRALNNSGPC